MSQIDESVCFLLHGIICERTRQILVGTLVLHHIGPYQEDQEVQAGVDGEEQWVDVWEAGGSGKCCGEEMDEETANVRQKKLKRKQNR